jgi:ABC-type transport system involved in multi-copper enzyme maturation permease subunit
LLVLARFDLERILRGKIGRFFGFVFLGILLIQLTVIYTKYLVAASPELGSINEFIEQVMPNPARFQASLLHSSMLSFLWFLAALIGGALISRDTLYRIRPLVYAHPVRPADYLASKALVAFGIPFCVQLPYAILPWLLSMLVAGPQGPIWPITPLLLIPAAAANSVVMASIVLGASSIAGTPKAGMGWVLGLVFATSAVGGILTGIFKNTAWIALSPIGLTEAWPGLLCGVEKPPIPLWVAIFATAAYFYLCFYIAKRRTRPSEAVI